MTDTAGARYDGAVPGRKRDPRVSRAFGRALKIARVSADLSRAELAAAAGLSHADDIGRLERGEREPSLSVFMALASSLGIGEGELLEATRRQLQAKLPAAKPPAEPAAEPEPDAKPSVAACYIVEDGRLLMVRRRFKAGTLEWAGPSGNIEPGETPEAAAVREVLEEVGVAIVVERRLGDRVHPATGRHLIYLACRILAGDPEIRDHEEIEAVEWVPIPEALERWAGLKGGVFGPVREYLTAAMVQGRGRIRPETPPGDAR